MSQSGALLLALCRGGLELGVSQDMGMALGALDEEAVKLEAVSEPRSSCKAEAVLILQGASTITDGSLRLKGHLRPTVSSPVPLGFLTFSILHPLGSFRSS